MAINISGQVPGEQQNGLLGIEEELLEPRTPEPKIGVVIVERSAWKYNDVKQETSAVVRLKHIEFVEGEDADLLRGILERAYARRTGNESLPIELDEPGDVVEPELDLDTPLEEQESSGEVDELASKRKGKS